MLKNNVSGTCSFVLVFIQNYGNIQSITMYTFTFIILLCFDYAFKWAINLVSYHILFKNS